MKIKIFNVFLLCIGIAIILTGCQETDQVKLDIYQYLNTDVKPIVAMHNDAVSDYNAYMEEEEADTDMLVSALEEDIIPAIEKAGTMLAELSYESEEVTGFVEQYQDVLSQEKEALEAVLDAVKDKDQDGLEKANASINSAMSAMNTYQADVRNFAASCGITLVEQETSAVKE